MSGEVIDDLYSRAVSKGYKKTKEEFINLIHTNNDVLNDMYGYVKGKGYGKSIDDFSILVGKESGGGEVKKKETTVVGGTPTAQKNVAMESASAGTSSVSPSTDQQAPTFNNGQGPLAPTQPIKKVITPAPASNTMVQNILAQIRPPATEYTVENETPIDKEIRSEQQKLYEADQKLIEAAKKSPLYKDLETYQREEFDRIQKSPLLILDKIFKGKADYNTDNALPISLSPQMYEDQFAIWKQTQPKYTEKELAAIALRDEKNMPEELQRGYLGTIVSDATKGLGNFLKENGIIHVSETEKEAAPLFGERKIRQDNIQKLENIKINYAIGQDIENTTGKTIEAMTYKELADIVTPKTDGPQYQYTKAVQSLETINKVNQLVLDKFEYLKKINADKIIEVKKLNESIETEQDPDKRNELTAMRDSINNEPIMVQMYKSLEKLPVLQKESEEVIKEDAYLKAYKEQSKEELNTVLKGMEVFNNTIANTIGGFLTLSTSAAEALGINQGAVKDYITKPITDFGKNLQDEAKLEFSKKGADAETSFVSVTDFDGHKLRIRDGKAYSLIDNNYNEIPDEQGLVSKWNNLPKEKKTKVTTEFNGAGAIWGTAQVVSDMIPDIAVGFATGGESILAQAGAKSLTKKAVAKYTAGALITIAQTHDMFYDQIKDDPNMTEQQKQKLSLSIASGIAIMSLGVGDFDKRIIGLTTSAGEEAMSQVVKKNIAKMATGEISPTVIIGEFLRATGKKAIKEIPQETAEEIVLENLLQNAITSISNKATGANVEMQKINLETLKEQALPIILSTGMMGSLGSYKSKNRLQNDAIYSASQDLNKFREATTQLVMDKQVQPSVAAATINTVEKVANTINSVPGLTEQQKYNVSSLMLDNDKVQVFLDKNISEVLKDKYKTRISENNKVIAKILGNEALTPEEVTANGLVEPPAAMEATEAMEPLTAEEMETKKADIESRRQEELGAYDEEQLNEAYTVGSEETIAERVNSKYDAELKTLEESQPAQEVKTVDQQIVDLRAAEQAEYAAMPDPNDEVAKKEIYDRYDGLLTPLLESQKEENIKSEADRLESMFAEEETPEGEPTEGMGVAVTNKSAIETLKSKLNNNEKSKVIEFAQKAVKTLKSVFPTMDIHFHEDDASYNATITQNDPNATKNTAGNIMYTKGADGKYTGRIDINLGRANNRTVAHEVAHAVMLHSFGENVKLFKSFRDNVSKVLSDTANAKLTEFANRYKESDSHEEFLVELAATLSAEEKQLDRNTVSKIAKLVNDVVSKLTNGAIIPFKNVKEMTDINEVVDFINSMSSAISRGEKFNAKDIIQRLNNNQAYDSGQAIPVVDSDNFVGKKNTAKSQIGDYKFPDNIDILKISDLPIKTLEEKVKEYNGKVVIITSDATGYGVDKNNEPIFGGAGFASNKKNIDDEIGFASVSIGTVKGTYTAAEKAYGKGKCLVLIMVQPPHTTINNSYGAKYMIRGLMEVGKGNLKDLKKTKESIKDFIVNSGSIQKEIKNKEHKVEIINDKYNELKLKSDKLSAQSESNPTDKKLKNNYDKALAKTLEKKSELDNALSERKRSSQKWLFNFIDNISEATDLNKAVEEFVNNTTFTVRKELGKGIIFENGNVRANKSTNYSKIALNNVGYNIYNFLKEYGDNTFLTDELILKNTGGYVVGGFELDILPTEEREKLINKTQSKGIVHPLFNAKLPGTNHFRLDGLYDVQENFSEFAKPDTEINLPAAERDSRVREIYKDDKFYIDESLGKPISKRTYSDLRSIFKIEFKEKYLKPEGLLIDKQAHVPTKVAKGEGFIPKEGAAEQMAKATFVSKSQKAVNEYDEASKEEKPKYKSKAQAAVHEDTGFVPVSFWVEQLKGKTGYLDDVIKNILDARQELKDGKVTEDKVVKSYLITIGSVLSQGGYYSEWKNKSKQELSDVFLEKLNDKDYVRPEGASAAYLITPDGEKLVDDIIKGTATVEQIKKMFEYTGFGLETKRANYVIETIDRGGIKAMTDLFNKNKGSDFSELYKAAINNFAGINEGKTGFFNQFFGVAERGVIDARELNAWVAGSMKLTPEQKAKKEKVQSSKKLGDQLLGYIEQVGIELGYPKDLAGYIAHHGIWDSIANSITTHEGEYMVVSKSQIESEVKQMEEMFPTSKSQMTYTGEVLSYFDAEKQMLNDELKREESKKEKYEAQGLIDKTLSALSLKSKKYYSNETIQNLKGLLALLDRDPLGYFQYRLDEFIQAEKDFPEENYNQEIDYFKYAIGLIESAQNAEALGTEQVAEQVTPTAPIETPNITPEEITQTASRIKKKIYDIVNQARAQGFSEEGIKEFLKRKGLTDEDITTAMGKVDKAATRTELSEETLPGYDKIMSVVQKGLAKGMSIDNMIATIQATKIYVNATDVQREMLVRDVRGMYGMKEKSAPSVTKLFPELKNANAITMTERDLLKKQFKDLARGAKDAKAAWTQASLELAKYVKELKDSGKITVNQVANVISKFAKVNMFNENSVNNFVDYMANVFADAEYNNKISVAASKLKTVRNNIGTKLGIAKELVPKLNRLFSINPKLVPMEVLDEYLSLVEMLGERTAVLTLDEKNDVISRTDAILDAINNEQEQVEILSEKFNLVDKVLDKDNNVLYADTIDKMVKDDVITEKEAEIMRKYKSEIYPVDKQLSPDAAKIKVDALVREGADMSEAISDLAAEYGMTEDEVNDLLDRYKKENNDLINLVISVPVNSSDLPSRDERKLAKRLKELASSNALKGLTNQELRNLLKVMDNINNGYISHYAQVMVEKMNAFDRSTVVERAIKRAALLPASKLYAMAKKVIFKDSTALTMIKRNPLYYVDQVFGDFKTKDVFDSVFKAGAQALSALHTDLKIVDNMLDRAMTKVSSSHGNKPNEVTNSLYKMGVYLRQLEYESNKGSKQVNPASAYIKATVKHINSGESQYGERDVEMLNKILEMYKDGEGQIDLQKIYNSFNPAEKAAIKTIQDVNESMVDKAMYTASIINGKKINPLANYSHVMVLATSLAPNATDLATAADNAMNLLPSTKAKSLEEREKNAKAINFDPFASTHRSAKMVLTDYHLTEPVRTARRTLSDTKTRLEDSGNMTPKDRDISNALKDIYDNTIKHILSTSYQESTGLDDAFKFVTTQAYRTVLAGTGRFVSELASNIGFAVPIIANNPSIMKAASKFSSVIMGTNGASIMNNLKSMQTSRVFPSDALSSSAIDTSTLSKTHGKIGGKAMGDVNNKVQQIYNNTLKKYKNSVEFIADTLVSTPDKAIIRPIWFGTFASEFKKITGEDPDFEKIASNDEQYMSEHADHLAEATNKADQMSVFTGATENAFMDIAKGKSLPNQGNMIKAFNTINGFMQKFMIYEYITARTAVAAAAGRGMISKKEGAAMLGSVVTRIIMYSMLSKMMTNLIAKAFGGGDDEEEDEKTFLQKLGQGGASAMSSLVLGRDFGAITKTFINFFVEKGNEKYLDFLRNGDYDPFKDNIERSAIPTDLTKDSGFDNFLINMSGPLSPLLKTTKLIWKNVYGPEKKEQAAIDRQQKEKMYRIPLEILGNAGFIPIYKDVRNVVNSSMYKNMKTSSVKLEEYDDKFKATLKKSDPQTYKSMYGEMDEIMSDQKKLSKEMKDEIKRMKGDMMK